MESISFNKNGWQTLMRLLQSNDKAFDILDYLKSAHQHLIDPSSGSHILQFDDDTYLRYDLKDIFNNISLKDYRLISLNEFEQDWEISGHLDDDPFEADVCCEITINDNYPIFNWDPVPPRKNDDV
jgi:hypothetical protein